MMSYTSRMVTTRYTLCICRVVTDKMHPRRLWPPRWVRRPTNAERRWDIRADARQHTRGHRDIQVYKDRAETTIIVMTIEVGARSSYATDRDDEGRLSSGYAVDIYDDRQRTHDTTTRVEGESKRYRTEKQRDTTTLMNNEIVQSFHRLFSFLSFIPRHASLN
jgi:hypothetical protein